MNDIDPAALLAEANRNAQRRFHAMVDRRGPDECWPWLGALSEGYGRFWLNHTRAVQATHISLALVGIDVPTGMLACHRCDNRKCVNPAHLFVGTYADNAHDRDAKGHHIAPNKGLTHCQRGHEFTPENTERAASGRRCRACRLLRVQGKPRGFVACPDCGQLKGRSNVRRHQRAVHQEVA